jgi:hypothetical protein
MAWTPNLAAQAAAKEREKAGRVNAAEARLAFKIGLQD